MAVEYEERGSDSPLVERVWRTQSDRAGSFTSIASSHWEMVVRQGEGKTAFIVRGPETKATPLDFPAGPEWLGITFKVGAFMPHLRPGNLIDHQDVTLPTVTTHRFWLHNATWHFPDYENADTFVDFLVRGGILARDPIVGTVLQGQPHELSVRALQYRFLHATGLTHKRIEQISRARYAMTLLQQGTSILDTVDKAGYFDQPHMTNALRRFIGQTPTEIAHLHPQP